MSSAHHRGPHTGFDSQYELSNPRKSLLPVISIQKKKNEKEERDWVGESVDYLVLTVPVRFKRGIYLKWDHHLPS